MLKNSFIVIASASILSFAGQKCDYNGYVRYIENRLGHSDVMKGAKVSTFTPADTSDHYHHVEKTAVRKNRMGHIQINTYIFDGCRMMSVELIKVDPATGDTVSSVKDFIRPDSTLQAICTDNRAMWRTNPFRGCADINDNCTCFVDFGNPARTSIKGCLENHDYEWLEKFGITRADFCR